MVKSKVNNLLQLLYQSVGNDIQIIDEKFDLLTQPGEHYGSIMLALDVTTMRSKGKVEILHLVAKRIPVSPLLRLAFDTKVTFKKEVIAYTVTIPTLVAFQKEYQIIDTDLIDRLFPKCYGAALNSDGMKGDVDEDAVILFENLKLQGYKTEDRLIGFDLDAARIIIEDLARFHAVPLALKIIKPSLFYEKVMPALIPNKGLEQLPNDVGEAFHSCIIQGAEETQELKPYVDRLQEIIDYGKQNSISKLPPPRELFGTMTHADFWTSNTMLLRDKNGKPIRNKIVDLQIMRYHSAIRDLIFFMFTSIANRVLDEHFDEFIRLYYDTFIRVLQQFHIDTKRYNWETFMEELNQVGPSEVYHILVMLKPICTERNKITNSLENFQVSDWSRLDLVGSSHREKLKDTILALVKRNWM